MTRLCLHGPASVSHLPHLSLRPTSHESHSTAVHSSEFQVFPHLWNFAYMCPAFWITLFQLLINGFLYFISNLNVTSSVNPSVTSLRLQASLMHFLLALSQHSSSHIHQNCYLTAICLIKSSLKVDTIHNALHKVRNQWIHLNMYEMYKMHKKEGSAY